MTLVLLVGMTSLTEIKISYLKNFSFNGLLKKDAAVYEIKIILFS